MLINIRHQIKSLLWIKLMHTIVFGHSYRIYFRLFIYFCLENIQRVLPVLEWLQKRPA